MLVFIERQHFPTVYFSNRWYYYRMETNLLNTAQQHTEFPCGRPAHYSKLLQEFSQ